MRVVLRYRRTMWCHCVGACPPSTSELRKCAIQYLTEVEKHGFASPRWSNKPVDTPHAELTSARISSKILVTSVRNSAQLGIARLPVKALQTMLSGLSFNAARMSMKSPPPLSASMFFRTHGREVLMPLSTSVASTLDNGTACRLLSFHFAEAGDSACVGRKNKRRDHTHTTLNAMLRYSLRQGVVCCQHRPCAAVLTTVGRRHG